MKKLWTYPKGERKRIKKELEDLKLKIDDRKDAIQRSLNITAFHQYELEKLYKRLQEITERL